MTASPLRMPQQDAPASDPRPPADHGALDACFPLVYDELRRLAGRYLRAEGDGHTLQPTALVHEAYLRLVGQRNVDWRNRAQFLGIAAEMMRRILVNHAVARRTAKRGGDATRVALDETLRVLEGDDVDLLALDGALQALAEVDARASRVVELRFFGGLGIDETAEVLGVSTATVKRDWTVARAWLRRELHAA